MKFHIAASMPIFGIDIFYQLDMIKGVKLFPGNFHES